MRPILRIARVLTLAATALACASLPAHAQHRPDPRPPITVLPYFGTAYILGVQAGVQLQVPLSPDEEWTFFADYNRWMYGLICVSYVGAGEGEDRCGEEGNAMHLGMIRTFRSGAFWQPYVAAGAGISEVVTREKDDRPSFLLETGVDVGGRRVLGGRIGLRFQTRPGAGGGVLPADYAGPVMAFRIRI